MKIIVFVILALLGISLYSIAQSSTIKVYAYQQAILGGSVPKGIITENGQQVNTPIRSSYNYYIYTISSSEIQPTEIWIKGQLFSVRSEIIKESPVIIETRRMPNKSDSITLVPKTPQKEKVLLLTPLSYIEGRKFEKAKALAKNNQLVLVYKMNSKFYYKAVKKFTSLPPEAMQ